ncbi:hypothetical protein [Streptomyces sp. NPDC002187]|uniref:hypothetical protein n=1 Tax=Streptomyces sp. NPDC002187 TaxID=3364637 RepID=UPI003698C87B
MAAPESSVQKAREARGEGEHATVHDMPKKKTAKKTTAKKSAGKRTISRKRTAS